VIEFGLRGRGGRRLGRLDDDARLAEGEVALRAAGDEIDARGLSLGGAEIDQRVGPAGAGANLALACDIVIATKSAAFIQAFCKIGLIPDSGGTYFLPRFVGTARAMGLALLGDKLHAEDAAAWGLIWKCVDDSEFSDTVEGLLTQLAQAPTRGLAEIKRALYASAGNTLETQLDLERDSQRELGYSADYREGVAAFLEKRPPRFSGR